MSDLDFYTAAPSRGSVARWMLEEVGEPYEARVLNLKAGEQRDPAYLAINPQGKVPALVHRGVAVTEVAAICAYLADAFPAAHLAPVPSDPRRGPYMQWLFFSPGCLEPAMFDRNFPRKEDAPAGAVGYRDLDSLLDILEGAIGAGPYLQGESFTAADVVIGSMLRWGMGFNLLPERERLRSYVTRLEQRPALQRTDAADRAAAAGG